MTKKDIEETPTSETQPTAPSASTASGEIEMMKAYATRRTKSGKKIYGGGGNLLYSDNDGRSVRMVPGQVRKVPKQVIERFNRPGCPPILVPPGSQKEGETVKE